MVLSMSRRLLLSFVLVASLLSLRSLVLASGFEVLDMVREGAKGNPPQDAWLLRKK